SSERNRCIGARQGTLPRIQRKLAETVQTTVCGARLLILTEIAYCLGFGKPPSAANDSVFIKLFQSHLQDFSKRPVKNTPQRDLVQANKGRNKGLRMSHGRVLVSTKSD